MPDLLMSSPKDESKKNIYSNAKFVYLFTFVSLAIGFLTPQARKSVHEKNYLLEKNQNVLKGKN